MSDPVIIVVDCLGVVHELPAPSGWRVMEIMRDSGLPVRATCGGSAACATCHVYVAPEWIKKLPQPNADEAAMLDSVKASDPQRSRLSCQIIMQDAWNGLTVTLASDAD
jgi:2Fe-2S ferredoxin